MTLPLLLDSFFINTVVLAHTTPLVSDTLVSVDVVDIQTPPEDGQWLILTGRGR